MNYRHGTDSEKMEDYSMKTIESGKTVDTDPKGRPYKGAGPKFSDTEREEVKAEVARLDRRGYTLSRIAEAITEKFGKRIGPMMVHLYLKQMREDFREVQQASKAEYIEEKVQQYREIRAVAWEAYERSMENSEKVVEELGPARAEKKPDKNGNISSRKGDTTDSLVKLRVIITKEGRLPDNQYLQTIMRTLEAERELLALDAPKKMEHGGAVNVINWEAILLGKMEHPVDPVAARLAEIESAEPISSEETTE